MYEKKFNKARDYGLKEQKADLHEQADKRKKK
jgi:hypothetical protein